MRKPYDVRRVTGIGSHAFLIIQGHNTQSGELIGKGENFIVLLILQVLHYETNQTHLAHSNHATGLSVIVC